jgi:hypothetical protein
MGRSGLRRNTQAGAICKNHHGACYAIFLCVHLHAEVFNYTLKNSRAPLAHCHEHFDATECDGRRLRQAGAGLIGLI